MIISIAIFIITLLVLVIIHELGHFLVAKKFGIKVLEFGFGIPPKLWGKKIGETIYSLNALPLGGFVRLQGEDEEGKMQNSRDFRAKPVGQRIIVVVAGVVMNLVLAWAIFYTVIVYQNFKIIYPTLEQGVYIGFLEKDFPAEQAGVNVGDRIFKVDGKVVYQFDDARRFIKEKQGQSVTLTLSDSDGSNKRELMVTPKSVEKDFLIGVGFSPIAIKTYKTPTEKLFSGITYSFDLTKLTFLGLGKTVHDLTAGNLNSVSKSVSGPVGLATISNDILSNGRSALPFYLWFVGVISLTLSIFNVLPIPALDGGRLFFLILEAVTGRKVKAQVEKVIHSVGFAVLLSLAALITYSDIKKMFP